MAAAASLGVIAGLLGPNFALLIGGVVLGVLVIQTPPLGLGLLVASRSSLDRFMDVSIVLGLNPASLLGVGVILLAGVVLTLKARAGAQIQWGGRITAAWTVWLAASGFSVLVGALSYGGVAIALGIKECVRLTSVLALYLLVVNLVPMRRGRLIAWCILLGAVAPMLAGMYQLVTGDVSHNVYGVRRIIGTFGHPNPFGVYLTTITIFCIGFFQDLDWTRGRRGVVMLFAAVAVTLLIFTYSRSSLGVFLGSLMWWSFLGSARRKVGALVAISVLAVALFPFLAWRFQDLFVQPDLDAVRDQNSLTWRLLNYRRLWGEFLQSPIVGHGLRATEWVNPTQTTTSEGFRAGFGSHNEVIRVLVEQGLIGLSVWIYVVVQFMRVIRRWTLQQVRAAEGGHVGLGTAIFVLFGTLSLLSAVGMAFLNYTVVLYVFFATIGVLYGGRSVSRMEVRT